MGTKRARDLPVRLERLRRRFDRWRQTRKVRSRIPEPLWTAAVKLAGEYGIHRTAKVLRVDYYSLKERVEGASVGDRTARAAGTTFVELPSAAWPGSGECTLELEDAGGAKLRVHLKGFEAPDLAALSRSFWQIEP